jgi:hypothetical protein
MRIRDGKNSDQGSGMEKTRIRNDQNEVSHSEIACPKVEVLSLK